MEFQDNDDALMIGDERFALTKGLVNLLSLPMPKNYTKQDLINYKKILLLTSAHKQNFKPQSRIASSTKWKYVNIIKKLFPPKRVKKNIIVSNKKETTGIEEELNSLPDKLKFLEDNETKIFEILRILELSGVIIFV